MRSLMLMALMAVAMPILAQNTSDHNFRVAKNLDIFNAIYRNLDLMYVDSLDADKTIGTAIRSMMRSLDPYTDYFPEDKAAEYKQMMTGKYAGIGSIISYSFTRKRVIINEPYEGMPAAEAGLKKGDIILSIDGESMAEKSTAYVSDHLRGEPGTTMVLKIQRPSTGKKMTVKVQRKAIQMPYLPYYGMQKDGIGYINYNQYVENSAKDVRRAFIDLKKQGMKGLVLDLRNNGGGSVQEALQILNMFLPKGRHLLSMKGKVKNANSSYNTTVEPIDTVMPIVVLVNEATASASEITSGTLQDYDRAVIMGTRTYGKGLVQIPNVSLPYNGKLKLTTAKYYIPSGRCIQALRYKHTDNGYVAENVPDSLTHEFRTAAGRIVRDGGGIKPDIEVKPDSLPNIAFYLSRVDTTDILLNYEIDYIAAHPTVASPKDFELSDADYEQFKQRVIKSGFTYDQVSEKILKELENLARFEGYYDDAKPEFEALRQKLKHNIVKDLDYPYNKQKIKEMIAADIMAAYYFEKGSLENSLRNDKQFAEAARLLGNAEEYQKLLQPKK
ncbi:MAG: S41 family peptidase [Prevotella sp.]|uniref:S41 family peptidase n=1 Tax=uncultured Prevotella sp. TaxID=159272 RepID=UPI0025E4191F|nr:S41 family peptidase [Prevotella sp.]MCI7184028.1 S41 family peptidase [Prevotella sp.]